MATIPGTTQATLRRFIDRNVARYLVVWTDGNPSSEALQDHRHDPSIIGEPCP